MTAATTGETVAAGSPTRLLPIFVYDSLRSDMRDWARLAMVGPGIGPAYLPGVLYDRRDGTAYADFAADGIIVGQVRMIDMDHLKFTKIMQCALADNVVRYVEAYACDGETFRCVGWEMDKRSRRAIELSGDPVRDEDGYSDWRTWTLRPGFWNAPVMM